MFRLFEEFEGDGSLSGDELVIVVHYRQIPFFRHFFDGRFARFDGGLAPNQLGTVISWSTKIGVGFIFDT